MDRHEIRLDSLVRLELIKKVKQHLERRPPQEVYLHLLRHCELEPTPNRLN